MKCQILFSWKNKKNITNLSSAEIVKRLVKVRGQPTYLVYYVLFLSVYDDMDKITHTFSFYYLATVITVLCPCQHYLSHMFYIPFNITQVMFYSPFNIKSYVLRPFQHYLSNMLFSSLSILFKSFVLCPFQHKYF